MILLDDLSDHAWNLITDTVGDGLSREYQCVLFAAAAAGVFGLGAFRAGAAMTLDAEESGWGCSFSQGDLRWAIYSSEEVDEDGTYVGHCWAQFGSSVWTRRVVDVMTGYAGPGVDSSLPVGYFPSASLTKSVKSYHAEHIRLVVRAARADAAWCQRVRALAA